MPPAATSPAFDFIREGDGTRCHSDVRPRSMKTNTPLPRPRRVSAEKTAGLTTHAGAGASFLPGMRFHEITGEKITAPFGQLLRLEYQDITAFTRYARPGLSRRKKKHYRNVRARISAKMKQAERRAMTDYERFVDDRKQFCDCCPECSDWPCAGVLAGGICDSMCHCDGCREYGEEGQ